MNERRKVDHSSGATAAADEARVLAAKTRRNERRPNRKPGKSKRGLGQHRTNLIMAEAIELPSGDAA